MFNDQQTLQKALDSRKFAEELLGANQRSHFDTQRNVAQDSYQTNFKNIQQQYHNLKNKIEAQRQRSEREFTRGLGGVADDSFNRMNAQTADLVSRGLTSSGAGNRATQLDTIAKGEAVNELLGNLGQDTVSQMDALKRGGEQVAAGERGLNEDLANILGDIGSQDVDNQMRYASALAGLAQSKEGRDDANVLAKARLEAQRAASGGGSSKYQKSLDNFYRNQAITAILNDINLETGEELGWNDHQKAVALQVLHGIDMDSGVKAAERFSMELPDTKDLKQTEKQASKALDRAFAAEQKHENYIRGLEEYKKTGKIPFDLIDWFSGGFSPLDSVVRKLDHAASQGDKVAQAFKPIYQFFGGRTQEDLIKKEEYNRQQYENLMETLNSLNERPQQIFDLGKNKYVDQDIEALNDLLYGNRR